MAHVTKKVFCLFGGSGGGAKGFKKAQARVGNVLGSWQCVGSIDFDEAANRDFARLTGSRATTLDLSDRGQYIAMHGHEPPPSWREATVDDVRRAADNQRPDCIFLSAPCKGFSGLLSEAKSRTDKYQAMNQLTVRGVWLALEAWRDDPVPIFLFENVPRLLTRGRHLADQICAMFRAFGYAVAETVHDCGEVGGLAQSRKRCLIVARHIEKVPPFLYEPPKRALRAVGDVLGKMHLPGDLRAGPMHRIPSLQWKTWVRLAFVEAGSDWRSLNKLAVEDGQLRDYLLVPEATAWHPNVLGVNPWERPARTITSEGRPSTGRFSVADPRAFSSREGSGYMGVRHWDASTGAVTANGRPGAGAFSIADPRVEEHPRFSHAGFRVVRWDRSTGAITGASAPGASGQAVADPRTGVKHNNCFRVVDSCEPAPAVTAGVGPSAGGLAVADPRPADGPSFSKYPVTGWDQPSGTVISGSTTGQGAFAVADIRSGLDGDRSHYLTGGHYGVIPWEGTSGAVSSAASHDNGRWSVADPREHAVEGAPVTTEGVKRGEYHRPSSMPTATDKLVAVIRSLDNTWHRPFTTLELAALQSLYDPEDPDDVAAFTLDGDSDSAWRERIGNAVPPAAAEAIAGEILRTLLLADAGETFQLSAAPVWVRPLAVGLSLAGVGS